MKVYSIRFVLGIGEEEQFFKGTWSEWAKFSKGIRILRIRKVQAV